MKTGLRDAAASVMVAVALVAVGLALGFFPHRMHARVGAALQRTLVAAIRATPGLTLVAGSAEHHTVGYADASQFCAAEVSARVRTTQDPTTVQQTLGQDRLPNLVVEVVGPHVLRARALHTFGMNPFDWSCWQ